jgi:hypothetical protein
MLSLYIYMLSFLYLHTTKEINNKSKDVPKGTEDKVYSAMVSPISVAWWLPMLGRNM